MCIKYILHSFLFCTTSVADNSVHKHPEEWLQVIRNFMWWERIQQACHRYELPCSLHQLSQCLVNAQDVYLWELTICECHLDLTAAPASACTFTFFDRSQSIKTPIPFSVMRMHPALMSWCKIQASYAAVWAIAMVSLRIYTRVAHLPTIASWITSHSCWVDANWLRGNPSISSTSR